jgi:hypothetical protein
MILLHDFPFLKKGIDIVQTAQYPLSSKFHHRLLHKLLCGRYLGYIQDEVKVLKTFLVPLTAHFRQRLQGFIGPKTQDLACEGNYYYDISTCGIGFHGDAERRRVVAVRLGATIPLHYQW